MCCGKCGMEYDGPPEKFTELCPLCERTPEQVEAAATEDAQALQYYLEQREAYTQGHIDD